jgi:hypothetical protein
VPALAGNPVLPSGATVQSFFGWLAALRAATVILRRAGRPVSRDERCGSSMRWRHPRSFETRADGSLLRMKAVGDERLAERNPTPNA